MSAPATAVNPYTNLANVTLFVELLERVTSRHKDLPGLSVFYGFAGLGKTKSATRAAHIYRAYYLECGESWTKAKFCKALLTELGLPARGTVADMIDTIIVTLMDAERPLIIDEADHIVKRGYVETIREIHDKSGAPIVLIGEEQLPFKLQQWERFHSRILDWVAAQPCDARDVLSLAPIYAPGITLTEDMVQLLLARTKGVTRRIAVNLARIAEVSTLEQWGEVDVKTWGNRPLYTGDAPTRRIV